VKRKFGYVAAVAALAAAAYLGSRLWAQGATGTPKLQTKIAVINLPLVIKNYEKYKMYEKDLEEFAKGYQDKETKIKADMTKARNDGKLSPEDKEFQMKKYQRDLEDLGAQFKKEFSKKQEEQLVTLYQEVERMVAAVAQYNGFEMVLQYSDAIDPKDKNNPMIIQRKVLGGVCVPMYAAPGLDISKQVYDNLNHYYKNPPKTGKQ
jgi:Skp family chaperone for outer membrane proteins